MPLFTKDALALIALCSEGLPRNINNLCFNALSLGAALQQKPIDRDVIRQVIGDLDIGPRRKRGPVTAKPEEKNTEEILEFIPADGRSSAVWFPKIAVAAAVLLAIGLGVVESQRWRSRTAEPQPPLTVTAKPEPTVREPVVSIPPPPPLHDTATPSTVPSVVPPAPATVAPADRPAKIAAPPPSLVADHTSLPVDVGTVRVAAGQTLLGICIQKYGACTSQLLQQIHDLNPSLNNPDHIESGQSIRVPVLAAQSSVGEQPHESSSAALSTHE